MNATLGAILLLLSGLPLILYINIVPHLQYILAKHVLPGVPDKKDFDFIVVGAGSAGAVVAGRLAENGHEVLLIEAGGPSNYFMQIPALMAGFQNTAYDWQYRTEPQKYTPLKATKGMSVWPRGKGLGGSSLLNYMQYMRGNAKDYDEWAALGASGWSFKDVLPFFKKSQNLHDSPDDVNPKYHGEGGPMGVRTMPDVSCNMSKIIEKSLLEVLNLPKGDCNAKDQNVVWRTQTNMNSGRRADSYTCFAAPYEGKGLTSLTFSHATKIIIDDAKVAKGVEVDRFGSKLTFWATKEVIVSSGAIGSPQLLMLSGIGPKEHLQAVGIEPTLDKPGVGENLQDHLFGSIEAFVDEKVSPQRLGTSPFFLFNPLNYWTWYFNPGPYNGPLGDIMIISGAHVHVNSTGDPYNRPEIQMISYHDIFSQDYGIMFPKNLGLSEEFMQHHEHVMGGDGVTFLPKLLRPKSRGTVRLASKDFHDHPIIDPQYFKDPQDVQVMADGLKLSKKVLDSPNFK